MTAIKPATPLPWHQDHERIGAQYRHISMSIGTDGSTYAEQKQNAAYVVAAANAYPELVAALRALTGALGDQYDQGTYRHNPATDAADIAARALLAKLGEVQS